LSRNEKIEVNDITQKAKRIKMIIVDCDGVLTGGRIILGSNGQEFKFFSVQDGQGIDLAQKAGLIMAIVTGRGSPVVKRRADELKIREVYQNVSDKLKVCQHLLKEYDLSDEAVAYVGDDLDDIPILRKAGLGIAPANAVQEAKLAAVYVTSAAGGQGAVREVIDIILKAQGLWEKTTRKYLASRK
jgi:3-deoxy-D-manno-octulosonate 8-phosphate phosphatase (KDO 8-P phosphatase)